MPRLYRRGFLILLRSEVTGLTRGGGTSGTEAVEGAALPLERVDDIERSDGLALGMLCVGDRVTHDVLEEASEHVSCLLVDQRGDALDAAAPCQPADRGLGDPQDGFLQGLLGGVSLGADLAVALADFASACHVVSDVVRVKFNCDD